MFLHKFEHPMSTPHYFSLPLILPVTFVYIYIYYIYVCINIYIYIIYIYVYINIKHHFSQAHPTNRLQKTPGPGRSPATAKKCTDLLLQLRLVRWLRLVRDPLQSRAPGGNAFIGGQHLGEGFFLAGGVW